jgi:hypothetical protein
MQSHLSRETPQTQNGPQWLQIKVVLPQMISTKPMEGEANKTQSLEGSPMMATPGMKTIKNHNSYRILPLSTNATIAKLSLLCEGVRLPQPKYRKNTYQYWNLKPQPRGTPTSLYLPRSQERGRGTVTRRQQVEIRNKHL